MQFATFQRGPNGRAGLPLVATAVHNGHEVRAEVAELLAVDEATRLREEDPFTDFFASAFEVSVIVFRSRFEVDLNRARSEAVYSNAEEAWHIEIWKKPLPTAVKDESLHFYDRFFADLRTLLDEVAGTHGGFVLYDLHSYNHRRQGSESAPAPAAENPVVNLGTGSLPELWRPLADTFVEVMGAQEAWGEPVDVRENVKFTGRQVARWVHANYGEVACALSIELKKVWMDEWTGKVDIGRQVALRDALMATVEPVTAAWRICAGH
ncbi:MAG: N-formylglutamate amidohydrolase [Acidimicrobiia bacterium]